jgi:protein MpaA
MLAGMTLRRIAALVIVAAAAGTAIAVAGRGETGHARPPARSTAAPAQSVQALHVHVLGRSVQGRVIRAYELRAQHPRVNVVVVGCIHGNEPAGIQVVARLARGHVVANAALWLIPSINPDGRRGGTRQNAHGVDLNRNFNWQWRPLGPPGTQQYAGPRALSEPESRVAHRLIARLRPAVTIWFHQPLGVVDESGGSIAVERRFAQLAHLPLRRLTRYPGSAASWQNHRLSGTSAFVVELPPGTPSVAELRRWANAVRGVTQVP